MKYQLILDLDNVVYETNDLEEFFNYLKSNIKEFWSYMYGNMSFVNYELKVNKDEV